MHSKTITIPVTITLGANTDDPADLAELLASFDGLDTIQQIVDVALARHLLGQYVYTTVDRGADEVTLGATVTQVTTPDIDDFVVI